MISQEAVGEGGVSRGCYAVSIGNEVTKNKEGWRRDVGWLGEPMLGLALGKIQISAHGLGSGSASQDSTRARARENFSSGLASWAEPFRPPLHGEMTMFEGDWCSILQPSLHSLMSLQPSDVIPMFRHQRRPKNISQIVVCSQTLKLLFFSFTYWGSSSIRLSMR